MGRIVVNKHTYEPSGITESAFANPGQIIVSNKVDEEDIYIINSDSGVTGIRKSAESLTLELSGGVVNNYYTIDEVNSLDAAVKDEAHQYTDDEIENARSYIDQEMEIIYNSAITLTQVLSGSVINNFNELSGATIAFSAETVAELENLEYLISMLSGSSSASYETLIQEIDEVKEDVRILSGAVMTGYWTSAETKDYVDEQIDDLSGNVVTSLSAFSGDVKNYIDGRLSRVYRFKESVQTFEDLPNDAEDGDVYNVIQEHVVSGGTVIPGGTNYAWNEDDSKWDELGGTIDLSGYVTKDELSADLEEMEGEISAISAAVLTVSGNIITEINTLSSNAHSEIESAKTDLTGYVNEISGNVTEKLYELSSTTETLSGVVVTLSANTESAIASAITQANEHTDSVAEVITTALSAVSATAVTAIQDIQFAKLESGYTVTHGNIKIKRENNIITIDLSEMDITGNGDDYEYE